MRNANRTQVTTQVTTQVVVATLLIGVVVSGSVWLREKSGNIEAKQMLVNPTEEARAAEIKVGEARKPASLRPASQAGSRLPEVAPSDFKFSSELAKYSKLRAKVFLSEDDKAEKAAMLGNGELLMAVGGLLGRPVTHDYEAETRQTAGLDLLFEALNSNEGRALAEPILKSIVADDKIEGVHLNIEARKNLGGIKAEVLYQWTAHDPTRANELQAILPGPVSKKIWANVIEAQNRNLHESAVVGADPVD